MASIRPELIERGEYRANLPVEEFIVPLLKIKIEEVLRTFNARRVGRKVLDVGCGGQPFRSIIENTGHEYIGVDAQNPLGIVDYVMELDKAIPAELLRRGPFDVILCTEVLEHVADWNVAFSNLHALLRSGGELLITCPHFYILHEQPYDYWRPTVHGLRFYAEKFAFEEVKIEALGGSLEVLGTILGANYRGGRAKSKRLADRVVTKLLNLSVVGVFQLIRRGWIQRYCDLYDQRYPTYLSNLAHLRKP